MRGEKRLLDAHLSSYLAVPVIDELYGPAALVLDPHKDDALSVTCCQLLVWFIPAYQHNLKIQRHNNCKTRQR